eukprot:6247017-Alexandrium_andersonii.AAC.1
MYGHSAVWLKLGLAPENPAREVADPARPMGQTTLSVGRSCRNAEPRFPEAGAGSVALRAAPLALGSAS